ncbi:NADPH-dependent 1-acyl dihydroxyacetone phosphate reductase [Entomophthora muscae]|uniref:NADPH-dependent 1-acyl dihydroxyacetone phosphate reductase n=1 Tax=Entomophthora muscae TaxID=34485 RepID=A0ACC2SLE7_9FUNG|nr:NADPH-dependent 1-acyl dihydroxyacetone phosphate reductase [Entomophthora muscae]
MLNPRDNIMEQAAQTQVRRLVVLITGCSNEGIGSYLAKHFALRNCITYAAARDVKNLSEAEGYGCKQVQMDICSTNSIQAAVELVIQAEGHIDILVNNAGVSFNGPVIELDTTKAANVMDTNVLGALRVTQAVAPNMASINLISEKIKNGGGTIVNIGSIVGDLTTPWGGIYSASKAALHSLTDALRLELRPFDIDVVIVKPGAVTSSIAKKNLTFKASNEDQSNADRASILVPGSFYKQVEGYVLKRINISQEDSYDTDLFGEKVVSWVLGRRNQTMTKLGYWLNPAKLDASYRVGFGGNTWAYTATKYLPSFAKDAALWSKFGLGTLAMTNNQTSKKEE